MKFFAIIAAATTIASAAVTSPRALACDRYSSQAGACSIALAAPAIVKGYCYETVIGTAYFAMNQCLCELQRNDPDIIPSACQACLPVTGCPS